MTFSISEDIETGDLEEHVTLIADALDVKIGKKDIEACHRLGQRNGNNPRRIIVRFVNRKKCDSFHHNKNKIRDGNGNTSTKTKLKNLGIDHTKLYINPNLSPYTRFLWGKCKKLHTEKLINKFWVYNGIIHIDTNSNGDSDSKQKIEHLEDLKVIFPGYDFETNF